jgi:hypothetical protein
MMIGPVASRELDKISNSVPLALAVLVQLAILLCFL